MPIVAAETEFARRLGALEGQSFQDEVTRFLRRAISDFQHVPPKPMGDGGLDGYSDGQSVAYCCYGPEDAVLLTSAQLTKKITKKFRNDLRSLFELKPQKKTNSLIHAPNGRLSTIMATGGKFRTVRLIVNCLNTHEVLGPLTDAFKECCQKSQCNYVDKAAGLTVWGPAELATCGAIDDATVIRLEQRTVLNRVEAVLGTPPTSTALPSTSDFDMKFDWIDTNGGGARNGTSKLRPYYMQRWLAAIAVEDELANNSPRLHQSLSRLREEIVVDATLQSDTQTGAGALIIAMRRTLKERLAEAFSSSLPPETIHELVDGELGRLIGECPLNWIARTDDRT